MRNILMLLILLFMSLSLQKLALIPDFPHSSVLLAIGFVILFAYTLSEIGSTMKLPRVTGYIITGLLLGPYASNIISKNVVVEIEMFNTLAIGLIAVTAGLELYFPALKKVVAPILTTSVLKVVFLVFSVGLAIFFSNGYFYDFQLGWGLPLVSLAMIFAVLCLGTSPAISVAVISEMNAKSRMSQMVLGSAIIKDVLVIVCLAVALSFAKCVSSNDADTTIGFMYLMYDLGLSLFAGIALGIILIGYIRFIHQEMFLFIAAMILFTAEISRAIHLELLLVFIVAGIVVRNFSKQEKILHDVLEKVSLPVFVIFFTNIGAGLNLFSIWQFLPIAALLFIARGLSFAGASWIAGYRYKESPSIRNRIWMGYLPQAGVTLGLISIASRDLPAYGEWINNIGLGLVTLNLLLGPVFLRLILKAEEPDNLDKKAGDLQNSFSSHGKLTDGKHSMEESVNNDREFDSMLESICKHINEAEIKDHFLKISNRFHEIFEKNQILPQKELLDHFVRGLRTTDGLGKEEIITRMDNQFRIMGKRGRDIYNATSVFRKELDSVSVIQLSQIPSSGIYLQKEDRLWIRVCKILERPYYWFYGKRRREVPLRKIAKFNMEPFIGLFGLQLIHCWYHLLGKHTQILQKSIEDQEFINENILNQVESESEVWLQSMYSDFRREFSRAAILWIKQLMEVNTVYLRDSMIRYSSVEPNIKENFEKAKKASIAWEEKFTFCQNRMKVVVQSALLSDALKKIITDKFFIPIEESKTSTGNLVKDVLDFFDSVEKQIREDSTRDDESIYRYIREKTWSFAEQHLQVERKTKTVRGNFHLLKQDISTNLKKVLPDESTHFQIASIRTPIDQIKDPGEIIVKKVNLHEIFEQNIMIHFLPFIEEKVEGVSNYLESLLLEMEQAFSVINCALEEDVGKRGRKELEESIVNAMTSEKDKILELYHGLTDYISQADLLAKKLLKECQEGLKIGTEHSSIATVAKNRFHQKIYKTMHSIREIEKSMDRSISDAYQKLKNFTVHSKEREIDRIVNKKMLSRTLDTSTIREFIDKTYKISDFNQLPRVYFRLFSLDPVQDKRFFVAYQKHWKYFKTLSREENSIESQKILIIGDRGMGKSSFINIAQIDIKTERLIRIDSDDNESPIKILARTLDCNTGLGSLLSTMKRASTTVIIDNVDQLLDRHHLKEFEKLFHLIGQSPRQTHWILSLTKSNFSVLNQSYRVRSLFTKIIDLNALDPDSGKEIIFGRHRLSGLAVQYPRTFINDWVVKLGLSTENEMFFRVLYEQSHGCIRHLIYLWLLSLKFADGKTIHLSMERIMERGLPMIHDFSTLQKYLLSELYCYHHMSVQKLSDNLGVSTSIIDNETRYIKQCGIIQNHGMDQSTFEIPNYLVTPVGQELKKEGIIHESSNKFRN